MLNFIPFMAHEAAFWLQHNARPEVNLGSYAALPVPGHRRRFILTVGTLFEGPPQIELEPHEVPA